MDNSREETMQMPIKMSDHRVVDNAHDNKHNACEDFELRFFEAVRDGPRRYEKQNSSTG